MTQTQSPDVAACEREPIHLLGHIQDFGFLIAVDASSWWIARASTNAAAALSLSPEDLVDRPLDAVLPGEIVHALRGALQGDDRARLFNVALTADRSWDIALHVADNLVVIEAEAADPDAAGAVAQVFAMVERARRNETDAEVHRTVVRQIRALTGFDRVMVYRFDEDGSGEVIAESVRGGLPPFLGLHYPASDIPRQARALYVRNRVRIVSDVDAPLHAVVPVPDAAAPPLDLTFSTLRAASPVHLDYLRNMKVAASMSVSLVRQDTLWGLIACHHETPRRIGLARRTAAELFGQTVSLLLENRERAAESAFEARGQRLQQQLATAMAGEEARPEGLIGKLDGFASLLNCDGIALALGGRVSLRGLTPTVKEVEGLIADLRQRELVAVHARHEIAVEYPPARAFAARAAGMMALPLSRPARDFLLFFRKEMVRTVSWAGDPAKPVTGVGASPRPRVSFELRREDVRGQSLPWVPMECRVGDALRVGLVDMIPRANDLTAAERRRAQERQDLLIAELNHRLRNILGLIRGVIAQSRDTDQNVEDFIGVIGGRIEALARAHDQITADQWGPAPFSALLAAEAAAYHQGDAARVVLAGDDALIAPEAFTTIALVLHEMMTNAVKYGALARRTGRVEITTRFDGDGAYLMTWREQGGPQVTPPRRRGFGSTVIARAIGHDLRGEAHVDYQPAGLVAEFVIPAAYVQPAGPRLEPEAAASVREPDGAMPADVLIVEDNMIIALDAEAMVKALGVASVRLAGSSAQALELIAAQRPAFALLDVNLGGETSFAVAERLGALGVPFAFASGYGEEAAFPEAVAAMPRLRKPFAAEALRAAVRGVNQSLTIKK